MGSNLSLAGITQDLEAMKSAGLGGATIFSLADTCQPWAGVIAGSPTPEFIAFTEPWWKLIATQPFISDSTIRFEMPIFGAVMKYAIKDCYVPASQRFDERPKLKSMRWDESLWRSTAN